MKDQVVSFVEIRPGLTGTGTVSFLFQGAPDKYIANVNRYLVLKGVESGQEFADSITFKIHPNKFFAVSSCPIQLFFRKSMF